MKQTGMMFKGELVRAILEGRKTQTRRIAKLPHMNPLGQWELTTVGGPNGGRTRDGKTLPLQAAIAHSRTGDVICPPNQAGDLIYVRETWQHANFPLGPYQEGATVFYRADYLHESDPDSVDDITRRIWKPAIHMPKSAARIWLEITGVRVERLHEITEADARAEGITNGGCLNCGNSEPCGCANPQPDARDSFAHLWHSTGVDWDANPWVWVYEFKRTEQPAAH